MDMARILHPVLSVSSQPAPVFCQDIGTPGMVPCGETIATFALAVLPLACTFETVKPTWP